MSRKIVRRVKTKTTLKGFVEATGREFSSKNPSRLVIKIADIQCIQTHEGNRCMVYLNAPVRSWLVEESLEFILAQMKENE